MITDGNHYEHFSRLRFALHWSSSALGGRFVPEIDIAAAPKPHSFYGAVLNSGIRLCAWIHTHVFIPYLAYVNSVNQYLPEAKSVQDRKSGILPIPADGPVNPILLMAALDERGRDLASDPEPTQAKLNAIYHAVLDCELLKDGCMRMLAALVTSGVPQDMAFAQVVANNIELGMYVERRLRSVDDLSTFGNLRAGLLRCPAVRLNEDGRGSRIRFVENKTDQLKRNGFFLAALGTLFLFMQRMVEAATNKITPGQIQGGGASQTGFNLTTTPGGVVGWTPTPAASALNFADFVSVTPSGSTITLANAPNPATSLGLFKNGQLLQPGAGNDYTAAGVTITLSVAPLGTDNFQASYRF